MVAYNHISDEIHDVAKELAVRGKLDALTLLLDASLISVRGKAAYYCLPVATERAIAVLEAIIALGPNGPSPEYLKACRALDSWRKGTHLSLGT